MFAGFLPADRAAIVERLDGADLILVLGAPVFTYHVEGSGPHIPPGAPLGATDRRSRRRGVVSHRHLHRHQSETWAWPRCSALHPPCRARRRPTPRARLGCHGFSERSLISCSRSPLCARADSIIVEEAPSSRGAMHDHLPMLERDTFHTCASGGLGHGLPAAVGVALARPGAKVIGLLGDGSAMYSIQGLWTAAEFELPVAFIIVNNSSYRALEEFGRHFGIDALPGVQLPHLDFCALAKVRASSHAGERCEDLDAALLRCSAARAPMLLEVRVK